jgi:hypothetical protein
MGHTLTLDLPEQVYQCLQQQAEQTGQSPETVAVQWLAAATQFYVADPLEQFIGAFSSHGTDWADHHDVYLGQAVRGLVRRAWRGSSKLVGWIRHMPGPLRAGWCPAILGSLGCPARDCYGTVRTLYRHRALWSSGGPSDGLWQSQRSPACVQRCGR